jgi:hypothetical protein
MSDPDAWEVGLRIGNKTYVSQDQVDRQHMDLAKKLAKIEAEASRLREEINELSRYVTGHHDGKFNFWQKSCGCTAGTSCVKHWDAAYHPTYGDD